MKLIIFIIAAFSFIFSQYEYSFEDMAGNLLDAVQQELSEIKEESKNEKV